MRLLTVFFIIWTALAKIEKATSAKHVNEFMEAHKGEMIALIFVEGEEEKGFLGRVFSLFSKDPDDTEKEKMIEEKTAALKIDVSNTELEGLQEGHGAKSIPYVVIYTPDSKVGYRAPPDEFTEEVIEKLYEKPYDEKDPKKNKEKTQVS